MKLAEFAVNNSLFVNMMSVFIMLTGIFSLMNLQRESFPNIPFDSVQISTTYPGSTAEQVERFITSPIEKEIRGITGIDEINSISSDGSSIITVNLDPDIKNKVKVVNDIQRAVDRVNDLPKDIDKPRVYRLDMNEHGIIEVVLSGKLSEAALQDYAEGLEDQILEIEGVSKVTRMGFRDRQIWVEVDPEKLRDYYLSMEEVMDALDKHNVTIPAGKLRTRTDEYSIKTQAEFYTTEEVAEVIIKANDAGNIVKVKDVARVRDDFEDEDIINKANGTRAINLVVIKKDQADAISIISKLNQIIKKFKDGVPAQLNISLIEDASYVINRRLRVLSWNGIFGFILVVIVLFVFLNPIAAAFTALGLPVAFLATFTVMRYLGHSINLATSFGLIMVLGMLVDDGIVISENVCRYVEEGLSPKEAAIKGTTEVMFPVLSTVLTTIAAFAPLMFMPGTIGKFAKLIPEVAIVALVASLLEAFFALPSHLSDFLGLIKKKGTKPKEKSWMIMLKSRYITLLNKTLHYRYLTVLVTVILIFLTIFIAIRFVPVRLYTGWIIEKFTIMAEAPLGTSLKKTDEMLRPVERMVGELPEEELQAYIAKVGTTQKQGRSTKGSQYAEITVYLTPDQQRERSTWKIITSLIPKLKELEESTGFERLYTSVSRQSLVAGEPVEIKLRGEKSEILNEIASKIMSFLKGLSGVGDVVSDNALGELELSVNVDGEKCKEAGLDIKSVATSVRNAFKGGVATKIKRPKAEKEIEVLVRFPEDQRDDNDSFMKLLIPNLDGKLIPLSKVATLEYGKSISEIRHLNGKRVITITAGVDDKHTTPLKVANALKNEFKNIPYQYPSYTLEFGGEQKTTYQSLKSLFKAFIMALLFIFIIFTIQFRSLLQPLIVMLAIPFGTVGVVVAFLLHRQALSLMAILGIIGMCGVVVNDSIVITDFINKLRRQGVSRRESIVQAGVLRMRPVLLTTITTVFGLLPSVYGIGGLDPYVRPMAMAISWGLISATALTLIILPCAYAILDDIIVKLFRKPGINNQE